MPGHHFLSYSRFDAEDFALRLHDALEAGAPAFSVWLDKSDLKPGQDWDEQIAEAIRVCGSLLFVMTRDSVNPRSTCKLEWTRAFKYKKPIIPLLLHPDVEIPFRLDPRQYLDFTGEFDSALEKLREHLNWLASPEGKLQELQYRLEDAQRELSRVNDFVQRSRIETDIALLEQQIAEQQHALENPQSTSKRTEENIAAGLERERQPQRVVATSTNNKFINPPPGIAPSYFQGRYIETKVIGDFLEDEALRLLTVVGRGGIGKTALVCRVLKALESGHLPDDGGLLAVDGIVYLSATGTRRLNVPNLFADLCKLLPDETAKTLDTLYKNPQATTETKIRALVEAFPNGRTIVLLDNFEDLLDPTTRNIIDPELNEALRALLNLPQHGVKVIITTRLALHDLTLLQPARQRHLHLEEGLESPYAEKLLREMDADGMLGLQTAPDDLLKEARERTRGFPRALEALFAILSADRDTSLQEILTDTEKLLPQNVVEALVGEAFSRLDPVAQQVMQALAVYNRPVSSNAVDYLLQQYLPSSESAPVLKRLVNMHFVRKEAGRYYLHPIDREYAFGRIPKGEVSDRDETEAPRYTQFALLHRGAEYFKQARLPREEWKTIEDLEPQLAEFELRSEAGDYDSAIRVLFDIDSGYLELWGHYQLMTELHERLQGKISNPYSKQKSLGNRGLACLRMGQVWNAITCYEQALALAREQKNRQSQSSWLRGLGLCYWNIGQIPQAIEFHKQALEIDREIDNRHGEGADLGNLGVCSAELGQTTRAIEFYERALTIAQEIGDQYRKGRHLGNLGNCYAVLGQTTRAMEFHKEALAITRETRDRAEEGRHLSNLGVCYADLGQSSRAVEFHEQALTIAREIGDRGGEGRRLGYLAEVLIDEKHYNKALKLATEFVKIGHEINSLIHCNRGKYLLALVHLSSGNITIARAEAEAGIQYDVPLNNYNSFALLGVIARRQDDQVTAQAAFTAAIKQTDEMLQRNAQNYEALDAQALAQCGLALCESSEYITAAIEAYRAARALCKDAGIVNRVLRLFDALAVADEKGILAEVRKAAAGEA